MVHILFVIGGIVFVAWLFVGAVVWLPAKLKYEFHWRVTGRRRPNRHEIDLGEGRRFKSVNIDGDYYLLPDDAKTDSIEKWAANRR